ncbi:MAG: hypothetical protein R6X17_15225, partial [Candidatus Competibacteraceae bacterium]
AKDGAFANGFYDFRFILWNAEVGGSQVGNILIREDLPVIEGFFTVTLDFGASVLDGNPRYLEVAVRDGSSTGIYTVLSPRQMLTATPYASYAARAPWSGLINVPSGLDDGDDDTLAELACTNNQIAKWNGRAWACAADKDTTYTVGDTTLNLIGNQFSVNTSLIPSPSTCRSVKGKCEDHARIAGIVLR